MFSLSSLWRQETPAPPPVKTKYSSRNGPGISKGTHSRFQFLLKAALATGVTQTEIARRAGVSQGTIWTYLQGSVPSRGVYKKLKPVLIEIIDAPAKEPEKPSQEDSLSKYIKTVPDFYETSDLNLGSYLLLRGAIVQEAMKVSDFPKRVSFKFRHEDMPKFIREYLGKEPTTLIPLSLYSSRQRLKSMAYNLA